MALERDLTIISCSNTPLWYIHSQLKEYIFPMVFKKLGGKIDSLYCILLHTIDCPINMHLSYLYNFFTSSKRGENPNNTPKKTKKT